MRWTIVLACGIGIALLPRPADVTVESWRLLAIFVATIVGSIVRPIAGGAVVLLGVTALALARVMPIEQALAGYAEPIVWLPLAAFFIARGMIKTGLGRRIAYLFIRAIGHRSIGLTYALAGTDFVLASIIPSNGARSGAILFPITRSLAEAYDSRPGVTARRLGAFLMTTVYQCEVIICSMYLTGQASNVLIAKFAADTAGVDLSYGRWLLAGLLPGLLALLLVPIFIFRLFPPEIRETPHARELAQTELHQMGSLSRPEWVMLLVFVFAGALWIDGRLHYALVALLGIGVLLITRVLEWQDVIAETGAWDVFIWYGGLVMMAGRLAETGITRHFAALSGAMAAGWQWWAALALLLLIYFYAHYGFASITAHATAMYTPFLLVLLAAGTPPWVAALSLAYFSNFSAGLTHYGTTPAPIYFGAGYVAQKDWWRIGLILSVPNILIWSLVGLGWWKMLRLW